MTVSIKRIYEPAADTDGTRILVDRLWPRGVSKARAKLALWMKEHAVVLQSILRARSSSRGG